MGHIHLMRAAVTINLTRKDTLRSEICFDSTFWSIQAAALTTNVKEQLKTVEKY